MNFNCTNCDGAGGGGGGGGARKPVLRLVGVIPIQMTFLKDSDHIFSSEMAWQLLQQCEPDTNYWIHQVTTERNERRNGGGGGETDTQTHRETETDRQRQRQRDRHTEIDTQRQRDRDRESENSKTYFTRRVGQFFFSLLSHATSPAKQNGQKRIKSKSTVMLPQLSKLLGNRRPNVQHITVEIVGEKSEGERERERETRSSLCITQSR